VAGKYGLYRTRRTTRLRGTAQPELTNEEEVVRDYLLDKTIS
jgi:hypothetical protein